MKRSIPIALVGDHSPDIAAHVAIPRALKLAASAANEPVECVWVGTRELDGDAAKQLSAFHGVWCVPGSPYESMDGALAAIQFAREQHRPFLGTCGGFQHTLIEYARNVLDLAAADHAESNPGASMPLIAPLGCALREAQGRIRFEPGSRVRELYGQDEVIEKYNCSFGLNARYLPLFGRHDLRIAGRDERGDVRVVELAGHPFFIATLFQPERSAFDERVHPLVRAFVEAAGRASHRS